MPDETNPSGNKADSNQQKENTQREYIIHGIEGSPEKQYSQENENASDGHPKPSLPVRLLHFLWRRRKWREIRKFEHPGPNWAEKTTVILTIGVVIVACIQAYIYWKQAAIMQQSIQQNERSIILGTGQLTVAGRSAQIADATLKSTEKSFIIDQRPYMVVESGPEFVAPGLIADKPVLANITFKNIGKTPAVQVATHIQFLPFRGKVVAKLTPEERRKARGEFISFIESTFAKLRADDEKARKEIVQLTKLSAGSDVAPTRTFFVTSPEVSVSGIDMPAVKTGEITLFYTGILSYIDSYGVTYRTEFCSAYFGPDPRVWHICDAHNTIR